MLKNWQLRLVLAALALSLILGSLLLTACGTQGNNGGTANPTATITVKTVTPMLTIQSANESVVCETLANGNINKSTCKGTDTGKPVQVNLNLMSMSNGVMEPNGKTDTPNDTGYAGKSFLEHFISASWHDVIRITLGTNPQIVFYKKPFHVGSHEVSIVNGKLQIN